MRIAHKTQAEHIQALYATIGTQQRMLTTQDCLAPLLTLTNKNLHTPCHSEHARPTSHTRVEQTCVLAAATRYRRAAFNTFDVLPTHWNNLAIYSGAHTTVGTEGRTADGSGPLKADPVSMKVADNARDNPCPPGAGSKAQQKPTSKCANKSVKKFRKRTPAEA